MNNYCFSNLSSFFGFLSSMLFLFSQPSKTLFFIHISFLFAFRSSLFFYFIGFPVDVQAIALVHGVRF